MVVAQAQASLALGPLVAPRGFRLGQETGEINNRDLLSTVPSVAPGVQFPPPHPAAW